VKRGTRALGIAESTPDSQSYLAGAVVRVSRVVDGLIFDTCTVGGSDATASICAMVDRLGREDVRYLLVAGIAPAWFNIVDLHAVADHTGLPTIAVSFEASTGLSDAIRSAFDDPATADERVATYRAQPDRHEYTVNGESVYIRAVGLDADDAVAVVRAFTPEGGRPEPLRVARLAARARAE
jgi:endonuclease V-like protein UPF0215 family